MLFPPLRDGRGLVCGRNQDLPTTVLAGLKLANESMMHPSLFAGAFKASLGEPYLMPGRGTRPWN